MLIDAHLHITSGTGLRLHPDIIKIFLNSTSGLDIPAVRKATNKIVRPFYGLHPWKVSEEEFPEELLIEAISSDQSAGIGECGLDFFPDYKKSREQQIRIFERQLELAFEYRRVLSLHCVRAWGELLSALKKFTPLPAPFILHSFYGSEEIAEIITKTGGYLSLSGISLRNPEKSSGVIANLPEDKILIESDMLAGSPEFTTEEHLKILGKNYSDVAGIRNQTEEELIRRVYENGKIFPN